jgi:transposase
LSIVVTGANEHDVTQLAAVLDSIVVKRKAPTQRRRKHLCADAGYRGTAAMQTMQTHGYIEHVVDRRKEADNKRRDPKKKARRWVVEVCHGWFNRFRKLLVRYEKLARSFLALNHLAAAIIAFRKVPLTLNIIYGWLLGATSSRQRLQHQRPFLSGARWATQALRSWPAGSCAGVGESAPRWPAARPRPAPRAYFGERDR